MNQGVVNLSSGVTEQTSVASQARAKPMALTSVIREISPTATLVRHNCNIYENTLLHFGDIRPLTGQRAACCYRQHLRSFNTAQQNTQTFAKGSHESQKYAILFTHK